MILVGAATVWLSTRQNRLGWALIAVASICNTLPTIAKAHLTEPTQLVISLIGLTLSVAACAVMMSSLARQRRHPM